MTPMGTAVRQVLPASRSRGLHRLPPGKLSASGPHTVTRRAGMSGTCWRPLTCWCMCRRSPSGTCRRRRSCSRPNGARGVPSAERLRHAPLRIKGASHLNLGVSIQTGQTVTSLIGSRIGLTIFLGIYAFLIAVLLMTMSGSQANVARSSNTAATTAILPDRSAARAARTARMIAAVAGRQPRPQ